MIPAELSNIPNLSELRLSGNRLTGCIPPSLRALLSGEEIELIGLPICAALADRINALETQFAEITTHLSDLASALSVLESQIAELADRLTALEAAPR